MNNDSKMISQEFVTLILCSLIIMDGKIRSQTCKKKVLQLTIITMIMLNQIEPYNKNYSNANNYDKYIL